MIIVEYKISLNGVEIESKGKIELSNDEFDDGLDDQEQFEKIYPWIYFEEKSPWDKLDILEITRNPDAGGLKSETIYSRLS